ncbi:hypothetical protein OQI_39430 [Streptomyces pharetrae CZA14]|uniref:Uncharacterized protein n=1 Tax=Streptomyces pharetrae CZA14 TaxID=1144883 RepID=A0ABX3Y638_9ACTN|nr:hypothetical protein OQI_39430 [Streptomyces pharetrae CZA14]
MSAPLVTRAGDPYTPRKSIPAVYVGTSTDRALSALFTATTYSTFCLGSVRENAYTPGPSSAYRSSCTPSRNAGCRFVSRDREAIDRYSGCAGSYASEACVRSVPI